LVKLTEANEGNRVSSLSLFPSVRFLVFVYLSGAHGRAGKGLLDLRLQHHDTRAHSQIVRSGDRGLILEDDSGSSRGDIEIAHAGDDADLRSWDREQP